ncbi:type I glutamate--ammonia ligase [Anaeromicropila populeti]|uniref:Glutamine synthetase n=1 Tax=Anaeromicropila populeti TaxID=37658 RepID=A0A1I6JNG7_9FIRM|nr:type I glutamate--ammonia ligase [Anaeromicropila populeti]SFR80080.1 glutamine synthetase [Anaeromicropila populeti]
MGKYTKQDIIRMVEDEDVEFIRLQFVDICGTLKNMAVTISQLDKVLNNQCTFDGAAVIGFKDTCNGEFFLSPDLDTFAIFPWRPQQGKVARLICDILNEDGTPFEGDSRYALKRVVKEAEEMGYSLDVGPECEFFLFDVDQNGNPTIQSSEKGGYFDVGPLDLGENVRREMVLFLEDMGFEIISSYHSNEVAQHEIDFKNGDALSTADNVMTFKMVVRTAAKRHGYHATFMPKPKYGMNGSGMHLTMKLYKDGKNIFTDSSKDNKVSEEAYSFIAGIMNHIEGMTLINNPIVNSYKRLVPGYNAPVSVTWSEKNRDSLIRVCSTGMEGTRVELRSPDAASNPYLVIAVCLAAGLEGIKNQMKLGEGMESGNEHVKALPTSLEAAIRAFEADPFIQQVLGKHIAEKYVETKKEEWNEYCKHVSDWEVEQYLYRI